MTTNEILYDAALDAIRELFGDQSVSKKEAIGNLESLIDEIKIMIDTLK